MSVLAPPHPIQLDLFQHCIAWASPPTSPDLELAAEDFAVDEASEQLDLFALRNLRLENARALVARGDLDQACQEYAQLLARYPGDDALRRELAHVAGVHTQVARALAILPV